MMWYYVSFLDNTGIELEARNKQHAEQLALELYPHKELRGVACCEFLDLPF